jgi:hypothetical protein
MSKLFLATFYINYSKDKLTRLVAADFIEDAKIKLLAYYTATDDGEQYYNYPNFISEIDISETII